MNDLFPRYQCLKNTLSFQLVLSSFLALLVFATPAGSLEWVAWQKGPQIALTFDDGPHPGPTQKLCDVLARYHVPGTFFIVGRVAVQYPDLLKELDKEGHEIANHTWNHADIRRTSMQAMRRDLDKTRALIFSATGKKTFLFRTPGATERFIRHSFHVPPGYELVLWNVHSRDQDGLSPQQISDRVLSQVKDGDVILMHNGLASTREALATIIPTLKQHGYEFVTVSELLKTRRRVETRSRYSTFIQG